MRTRIALLAAAFLLPACSPDLVRVKPYDRGTFARPVMADSLDPVGTAMTDHAYFSREASFGGAGVGGGGCGCN